MLQSNAYIDTWIVTNHHLQIQQKNSNPVSEIKGEHGHLSRPGAASSNLNRQYNSPSLSILTSSIPQSANPQATTLQPHCTIATFL